LASQAPVGNLSSRQTRPLPGTRAPTGSRLYRRLVIGRRLVFVMTYDATDIRAPCLDALDRPATGGPPRRRARR
jgi:hypothetical protein